MNLSTGLPIIANVARVVTRVADRVTGGRVDYPHLVALGVKQALSQFRIDSVAVYGKSAWVEVMEDSTVAWGGYWSDQLGVWVETQFGEIVDLNASVAHLKRGKDRKAKKARYSPPMLWSIEIPKFYKYASVGAAEFDLTLDHEKRYWAAIAAEIAEKCVESKLELSHPEFPNEPILCPGRKLLDDTELSFKHFDRSVSVFGIPDAPF